jgi:hypothetical protein
VSAQIITALRIRAEFLDGEADRYDATGAFTRTASTANGSAVLRLLAAEFRAVADAAEGKA